MSDEQPTASDRATELLELHDRVDCLDEQIRIRDALLRITPLVSVVLAVPLLVLLFLNEVSLFAVYPAVFALVLGAILYAVSHERRRLQESRGELEDRIEQFEQDARTASVR